MNDSDAAAAELLDCDFDMSGSNFLKGDDPLINTESGHVEQLNELLEPTFKANGDSSDENLSLFSSELESAGVSDRPDNPAVADAPASDIQDIVADSHSNGSFELLENFEISAVPPNPTSDKNDEASDQEKEAPESLSAGVTDRSNLDTSDIEIIEEGTGSGLTPDDYFYQQLNPDELSYFNDHKANLDMRCLVCSKQVTSVHSLFRHPSLSISTCSKCCSFLLRDGWTKDEAGCDQECRWCGQGGNILLCDGCPSSFCENCLFKNLGRKYLKEAKTSENWKCLMCDSSPILKLRADHYEVYKLQVAGRSKKRISEKQPVMVETDEKFNEEVVKKFLDGAFKSDVDEILEKLRRAVQEEKDYCYENIGTLDIEALKRSTKNLRKVFLDFEGYFNAERTRVTRLFNRNFPNHKMQTPLGPKVQDEEEDQEKVGKKVRKPRPAKKKKVQAPKPFRKSSMPVVVMKSVNKKKKVAKTRPTPKSLAVKKRQPPPEKKEVSRVGSRKRPASPEAAVVPSKSARTSSRGNRSSSPQPTTPTPTSARGRRSGAAGKTVTKVDSPSSSRSPSPPPRALSKPFVTPATKKAFPDTPSTVSSPIIPSLSGILSQYASGGDAFNGDSATKSKPKIGPKSRILKQEPETEPERATETPPKKRLGPKSKIGRVD